MADLFLDAGHWDDDDYFGHDPEESVAFSCKCKWCNKRITMTPTDDGWRPMHRGVLHVCPEREASQRKSLIDMLPDLTTPECQFCKTNMVMRRFNDDESWSPFFRYVCPDCDSMGPKIEMGNPLFSDLLKNCK